MVVIESTTRKSNKGAGKRTVTRQKRRARRAPALAPMRGFGDPRPALVKASVEMYQQRFSHSLTTAKRRQVVRDQFESALRALLPLVKDGWHFELITLTVPDSKKDLVAALNKALWKLRKWNLFAPATYFVFRHLAKTTGRPHFHVLVATPDGLGNHERLKKKLKLLTGGNPEVVHVYLNGVKNGTKKPRWSSLTQPERRVALETLLLYLTREFLGKLGLRKSPWRKRVTSVGVDPTRTYEGSVFPLKSCEGVKTWIFEPPSRDEGNDPSTPGPHRRDLTPSRQCEGEPRPVAPRPDSTTRRVYGARRSLSGRGEDRVPGPSTAQGPPRSAPRPRLANLRLNQLLRYRK